MRCQRVTRQERTKIDDEIEKRTDEVEAKVKSSAMLRLNLLLFVATCFEFIHILTYAQLLIIRLIIHLNIEF